jgi:hypothetical protein
MTNENTVVSGIYSTNAAMDHGVEALRTDGFPSSNISVLYSETPAPSTLSQRSRTKEERQCSRRSGGR